MFSRKNEGTANTMIYRPHRPTRLVVAIVALCGLWWMFRSDFVLLIPIVQNYSTKPPTSRVAKISVAVNSLNSSLIQMALATHQVQNELHGYSHYIATDEVVADITEKDPQGRPRGAWSKPAYILSIIVAELTRPESERAQWIFWFDADTIVLNPQTPLEIFLPPESNPELANVHLLMASNWDGLNSGAFALRVHPWSVSLLSGVLAYPMYLSNRLKTDRFRDQSAFQWLLQARDSPLAKTPMKGRENWVEVPMRWFNSLPINNAYSKSGDWIFNHNMTAELFDKGTNDIYKDGNGRTVRPWKVMQGDMILHFAGTNPVRDSWMLPWLNRTTQYLPEWSNATKQLDLKAEAERFWRDTANKRIKEMELTRMRVLHTSQAAMHAAQATMKTVLRQQAGPRTTTTTESAVAETSEFKIHHEVVRMTGIPKLLTPGQSAGEDPKRPTNAAPNRQFVKAPGKLFR